MQVVGFACQGNSNRAAYAVAQFRVHRRERDNRSATGESDNDNWRRIRQAEVMLRLRVQVLQFLRSARSTDALTGACNFPQSLGRAVAHHRVARIGKVAEYRVTRPEPAVVAGGEHDEVAGMPVVHRANVDGVDLTAERVDGLHGDCEHAWLGGQTRT